MQIIGPHSLDLYCDNPLPIAEDWMAGKRLRGYHLPLEFPQSFVLDAQSPAEAKRTAQRAGWVFHRDGTLSCPRCVRWESKKSRRAVI